MYDQFGVWVEQDYDEPERIRCAKGHFLPKKPTGIFVSTCEGNGILPLDRLKELPPNSDIEPYWHCKCGSGSR